MLYPIMSEKRGLISLDGIWNFIQDGVELNESIKDSKLKNAKKMPVPCSYNDIYEGVDYRDFVGWVWYERDLFVTQELLSQRLVLRFGSATHTAKLYINGKKVLEHKGGFLPFEIELNDIVKAGKNDIKIAVNNVVDYTTLPVGKLYEVEVNGVKKTKNAPMFDFFNYAGIQRPVKLYTTPKTYVKDVTVITTFDKEIGKVSYTVDVENMCGDVRVSLTDEDGLIVASGTGTQGILEIKGVKLWEPLNAYLYEMKVEVIDNESLIDQYFLPIGVRTVEVKDSKVLINNKPFYFKGFGKHEDSHIHGRGFDEALNVKDIGLLKWLGANSFRTSHYPYSEEMMRLCASEGIVVVDEVPAVGLMIESLAFFGGMGQGGKPEKTWEAIKTFDHHKDVLKDLIQRDKNNPAVCVWSVANEADTFKEGAREYFEPLIKLTKELDPQKRPVTIVLVMMALPHNDLIADLLDIVSLNRYYGWYMQGRELDEAEVNLRKELQGWKEKYPTKPLLFTEYGADTVAGLHDTTPQMFTEEYQVEYYEMNHKVFDEFENVVGEQAWNFADFATGHGLMGFMRVQGNKKGAFTRDRKPKMMAHEFKKRWEKIPEFNYKK